MPCSKTAKQRGMSTDDLIKGGHFGQTAKQDRHGNKPQTETAKHRPNCLEVRHMIRKDRRKQEAIRYRKQPEISKVKHEITKR